MLSSCLTEPVYPEEVSPLHDGLLVLPVRGSDIEPLPPWHPQLVQDVVEPRPPVLVLPPPALEVWHH